MKVLSTNIGKATRIEWNGKTEMTGIYKYPTKSPVYLAPEAVAGDTVANRKVHGGVHKACYLFSEKQYPYWKALYPELRWDWGMFGENLTMAGMDESDMCIGDIYAVGTARVQVSQPREPCYKLGIRFGSQQILKQFIDHGFPGAYLRILQEGKVKAGDELILESRPDERLTVRECFQLILAREKPRHLLEMALRNEALPEKKRQKLSKYH